MPNKSSRLSSRHLIALGTFLVPLLVLAALGWNELQRTGATTEASLEREARQFLASARQAVDQQIELQVPPALTASERLLSEYSPTRAAIKLRNENDIPAVLDIVLLDEQADLEWPTLPTYTASLPMAREPQDEQGDGTPELAMAETLIAHGDYDAARLHLEDLIATLRQANPLTAEGRLSRDARADHVEDEVHARFRLGAVLRRSGEIDAAVMQFREVARLAEQFPRWRRRTADMPAFRLVALGVLAELGTADDRIDLLREIAEDGHRTVADGLSSAVANRLANTFGELAPERDRVDRLLAENDQRAATREFAGAYELWLKGILRMRLQRLANADADDEELSDERVVLSLDDHSSLFAMRRATDDEQNRHACSYVLIHFDLNALLDPALEAFREADGNFALAVYDPDNIPLLESPKDVPSGYTAPTAKTHGLTLSVYPADPVALQADADAAAMQRTLLVLALFFTALGGALWSWRSVTREAELAAMKIDLVSRVSHELKTPLALIRMYGETLGMGRARTGDQTREFGTIISRESERLTTLIQRILDFSRQQAGTLTYTAHVHDLGELLRETAYAYAPHLEEKGAMLIDSLPLGVRVSCDKDGLEGAIVNLLENATKYGGAGRGADADDLHEIELSLDRSGDEAVIEVKDRGRGIPKDEYDRVFEGFYRASNSGETRGAGLGLGIVQHFARAHGGDIEALPREGGGTIMRLSLPLATRRDSDAPEPRAPSEPGTPA